ncbi:hypothetical protein MRX96_016936 [Rhipicephalus microplus]
MRRASFPPPVTLHTPPGSPLRKTASSPSFHFLPCSPTGLLQESPGFTPTPPRRCETEANVAGIKKQTVKTGDSLPQLPFQGFTPVYWEWNASTFSTQAERAKESSTQTEPLTVFSDGARLNDSNNSRHWFCWKVAPRCNWAVFLTSVAALATFILVLVVIGTALSANNSDPKMDGFERLPDLFENKPSISVVHKKRVNITATTTARPVTTAPIVAKRSAAAVHSAWSAKMRKATKTVHSESIPTEDASGTAYAVKKLPTTAGLRRTSTSTTLGHRKGGQVFGTQDPAKRKHHLEEVTGVNDISSRTVYKLDDHIISELLGEYAGFRPKKRIPRSPSMTPAGDFVKEIV